MEKEVGISIPVAKLPEYIKIHGDNVIVEILSVLRVT